MDWKTIEKGSDYWQAQEIFFLSIKFRQALRPPSLLYNTYWELFTYG
jgi:hypothetical protein